MSEATEHDLESERQRLELEKLRLEIKYAPRAFFAQLANTFVVACLAISVLYLFQRPQLEQMKRGHEAMEKQQAISLLIAAQGVSDEQERFKIVQALSASFPENQMLASFTQSNRLLAGLAFRGIATHTLDCIKLRRDITSLDQEIASTEATERNEIAGSSGQPSGLGPVAKIIAEQRRRLQSRRTDLAAEASAKACPPSLGV